MPSLFVIASIAMIHALTIRAKGAQALALAACFVAIYTPVFAAEPAAPDPVPNPFSGEIRRFESWDKQNSWPTSAVLFTGSSSIRMWPTRESFPELTVINRGFGGSQISDVNHFFDRAVLKYKPEVIVLYAGDNDIAGGKSPEQVLDDFRTFVARVHNELPDTTIVYLPIKPSIARWKLWPAMSKANALIESLADADERLEYVDTATPMLGSDGKPRPELLRDDGLHMTPAGYQVWSKALAPVLEELVGEAAAPLAR